VLTLTSLKSLHFLKHFPAVSGALVDTGVPTDAGIPTLAGVPTVAGVPALLTLSDYSLNEIHIPHI
jgi:hypothetical protein